MKKAITVEETIWLGLDVHKKTIVACWLLGGQEEVRQFPNTPGEVKRLLKQLGRRGTVRACYEAGPCGYEIRRQLEGMGVSCAVIAPSLIPKRAGDRVKTDRRDAQKLARLYRAGELTEIRVPTESEESVRDLVRCREDATEDRLRAWHRLIKFLLRYGRIWTQSRNGTKRHWAWLRAQRFDDPRQQRTYEEYLAQVDFLVERLRNLDQEIAAVASEEPWRPLVDRLKCLRGISTLSALTLVVEIGDFRRFKPRELSAFVGLVPSMYASGDTKRPGGITKAGNSHVRRIVIEAAHHARHRPQLPSLVRRRTAGQPESVHELVVKAQHRLHLKFVRLRGRGKNTSVAVTAIARELLGFIWALMVEAPETPASKGKKVFVLTGRTAA
jgi:transposase